VRATIIYGLIDPRTHELRYVGKTSQALTTRYHSHIGVARRGTRPLPINYWIGVLLGFGLKPELLELQTVAAGDDWIEAEQFWIEYCRAIGCRLLNLTHGGEGVVGLRRSTETRIKIGLGNTGKVRSAEFRAAMSLARIGRKRGPTPPETRAKIAAALKGKPAPWAKRKQTPEDRAKKAAAAIARYQRPGEREKTSAAVAAAKRAA
jgi:hypothetical protein